MSQHHDEQPHLPPPSLWPVGFAVGVACVLVGLVVSWSSSPSAPRSRSSSASSGCATSRAAWPPAPAVEPETARSPTAPPRVGEAQPAAADGGARAYPRRVFLEASTLGLGARDRRPRHGAGARLRRAAGVPRTRTIPTSTSARLDDFPEGEFVDRDVHRGPEAGRGLPPDGVRPQQRHCSADEPSFTIISNHCAHLGCPVQPNGPLESASRTTVQDGHDARRPCSPPASAARATAASTTPRATAPPARPCARSTATRSRSRTATSASATPFSVGKVEGDGHGRDHDQVRHATPASTWTGSSLALPDPRCRADGAAPDPQAAGERAAALPARLARGALGARRRGQVLPLPQGPARHNWLQTLGSATLTAFLVQAMTGVILAMYYKPDPDTAYDVDPAHHERRHARLARARHAQVGRERLHHPDVPPHGARLPVRRLQVPARAELDHRRAPARARACSRASPATCCRGTRPRTGRRSSGSTSTARRRSSGRSSPSSCRAGPRSATDTLRRFYAIHMLLLPGAIIALIGLHLYLVIRLGVTSPPWSKTAAGRERTTPSRPAAKASSRPASRGGEPRLMASRGLQRASARSSSSATRRTSSAREAVLPVRDVPRHGDEPRRRGRDHRARVHLELHLRRAARGRRLARPALHRRGRPGHDELRPAARLVLLLPLLPAADLQVAGDGRPRHGRHPDDPADPADRAAVHRPAAASGGCCAGRSRSSRRSSSSSRWACSPTRARPRRRRSAARTSLPCPSGRRSRASRTTSAPSRARSSSRSRLPELPHLPRRGLVATSARPTCRASARRGQGRRRTSSATSRNPSQFGNQRRCRRSPVSARRTCSSSATFLEASKGAK